MGIFETAYRTTEVQNYQVFSTNRQKSPLANYLFYAMA